MRGYFGIGVEGISKQMNIGSLFRTAHAFGASFVFTVAAAYARAEGRQADTSDAPEHLPLYQFPTARDLVLPRGCALVGVEVLAEARALPSFRHPPRAAYVLGPERGALSPELAALCDHLVRIPSKFCINLAVAGGRRHVRPAPEPGPLRGAAGGAGRAAPAAAAARIRRAAVAPQGHCARGTGPAGAGGREVDRGKERTVTDQCAPC